MKGIHSCSWVIRVEGPDSLVSDDEGISLLSTPYVFLSIFTCEVLSPYVTYVIREHYWGLRYNRSSTEEIMDIHQTLDKDEVRRR
jgi:hypothetical protein